MNSRDDEYTEYVSARMTSLRRVAYMLCQDWHRADDLVQATITQLYVHWGRARAADHIDAYARTIFVREFLRERRSAWARPGQPGRPDYGNPRQHHRSRRPARPARRARGGAAAPAGDARAAVLLRPERRADRTGSRLLGRDRQEPDRQGPGGITPGPGPAARRQDQEDQP